MKTIERYNIKIFTDNIEETAVDQIHQLLSIDVFSRSKVRIMPDVHAGAGCVIGFTGDLGDKVIPNIVGVDIGCGMRVQSFEAWMDIDYHLFNEFIINRIPSGRNIRDGHSTTLEQKYMDVYREAKELILQLKCYRELKETKRLNKSIGTLGGGNHFIELDKDENRMIEEYKAAGRRAELQDAIRELHNSFKMKRPGIPDALCYLEGSYREDYLHDMRLCQRWAILNRQLICDIIMDYFRSNGYIKRSMIHSRACITTSGMTTSFAKEPSPPVKGRNASSRLT